MHKNFRKGLLLAAKILLSAALLTWVLRGVSWRDFVLDADGETKIHVSDVQPDGRAAFRLTLSDEQTVTRDLETLAPVAADGPATAANYVRPGFFSAVRRVDYRIVVAGMIAFLAAVVVTAYRWWRLLAVQGIRASLWEATRLTWLGTFFNYIVPGTVGGDLVKAYYLSRHVEGKTTPLVTVVVDRLIGLTGLTLLSVLMLSVVSLFPGAFAAADGRVGDLTAAMAVAGGVLGVLGLAAVFLFSRRIRRWFRLGRLIERLPMSSQITRVAEAVGRYRDNVPALAWAMAHTFVAQLCFIGGIAAFGFSLGLAIPWYQYVIYVPLIYIIASVPVVPGGVGLVESFYVAFFLAWATRSEILALALFARLTPMFWALPGAIVAVTGPRIPPVAELRAVVEAAEKPHDQPAGSA